MATTTATETKTLVNYRVEDGIAVIELSDPPANTYTYEMNRQLDECILKARMDNDVYVLLLTGAGDKFFSAGANIKMLSSVDPTFKYYFCLHANEMLLRLEHTPKLVIAAINGHCVGGGLEIAMAADIRIARRDAGKVGLPEINLGVLPGTGGTQRLSRIVGKSKAIELMVTGNTFTFEEAKEMGIVNDIYERDNFMENIMEYARQFTSAEQSREGRGQHQAELCRAAGKFRWSQLWPLSANYNSVSSPVTTPRKAWLPTWRSGRRRLRRNNSWIASGAGLPERGI